MEQQLKEMLEMKRRALIQKFMGDEDFGDIESDLIDLVVMFVLQEEYLTEEQKEGFIWG